MRIGSYQFRVTGNIEHNFNCMKNGIEEAAKQGIRLLLFPECAVTGYPPRSIKSTSVVDYEATARTYDQFMAFAERYQMHLVVGTIIREEARYYNCAIVFFPDGRRSIYRKRALWGWDRENFCEGCDSGVFEVDNLKVGIRICYEIRFPEFFRELYRAQTDLNIMLFFDETDNVDLDRYSLIKGHIQTRAVENVCPILTCNTCSVFQTAPTGFFDRSGKMLAVMEKEREGLLVCEFEYNPLTFGEEGRKLISDSLME